MVIRFYRRMASICLRRQLCLIKIIVKYEIKEKITKRVNKNEPRHSFSYSVSTGCQNTDSR